MFKKTIVQRDVINVDDRRAVMVQARGRTMKDQSTMSNEGFIRNALKDRMGWPRRDPAPRCIIEEAKRMAKAIKEMKAAQVKA